MKGKYWYIFDNIKADSNESEILLWISLPQSYRDKLVLNFNFSPKPFKIVSDDYGLNKVALWRINDISDRTIAIHLELDIMESDKEIKSITKIERKRFLVSEQWIEITSDIESMAKEITKHVYSNKGKAFALFEWCTHQGHRLQNLKDIVYTFNYAFPNGRKHMPWRNTTIMDEKFFFINEYRAHRLTITELCKQFGISRTLGYKYIERYKILGMKGLEELSCRSR